MVTRISAGDDIYFTKTMAEILERQNCLEDALMIYKILYDTSPWDEDLKGRIDRLYKTSAERAKQKRQGSGT